MLLSSTPHAWLRPFYVPLKADPAFHTLAIPLRFVALCELVAVEHPERANWMKQWSPAAQQGTLKWLDSRGEGEACDHQAGAVDGHQGHAHAALRGSLPANRNRLEADGRR
jgi:hypothetical protein